MENLSAENSLRIITETIERSRNAIAKNTGKPLILWGSLVTVTSVIIWALWSKTGTPMWNLLWFAMTAIGAFGTMLIMRNQERVPESETKRILGSIWKWFGIFSIGLYALLWVVALILYASGETAVLRVDLTLIISLMMGLCGAISGAVMKMKSVSAAACVATALAVLLVLLVPDGSPLQILSFAILGVIALIIPGIIFQKNTSK